MPSGEGMYLVAATASVDQVTYAAAGTQLSVVVGRHGDRLTLVPCV